MKFAVIGASRGIGLSLVKSGLSEGHEVTALVRDPSKLAISDSKLKILKGDIRDITAVRQAVSGQDAVCICIGIPPTLKPVDVFSQGTSNVLTAIKSSPGLKLIVVTGIGAGDSKGHGGFFFDKIMKPLLLGTIYQDKDNQESILKSSAANWLIVRPGFLTNGPRTAQYRVIDNLTNITAGKISRLDVADFILKQLVTPTHFRKTPLICY